MAPELTTYVDLDLACADGFGATTNRRRTMDFNAVRNNGDDLSANVRVRACDCLAYNNRRYAASMQPHSSPTTDNKQLQQSM